MKNETQLINEAARELSFIPQDQRELAENPLFMKITKSQALKRINELNQIISSSLLNTTVLGAVIWADAIKERSKLEMLIQQ